MEILVLTTTELEQNTHLVLLLFHKGYGDFESQNGFRLLNFFARRMLVLLYFVIWEKAKTLKQNPCFASLSDFLYYSYISNQSQSFWITIIMLIPEAVSPFC